VLDGGRLAMFEFQPARAGAALYVDVLEVSGAHAESFSDFTNSLVLGMNVYYSEVVSTNAEITSESLNRLFGPNAQFNLIWVPGFVGPALTEAALGQNGTLRRMNQSLRQSLALDSDGDGIANALDPYPISASAGGSDVEMLNVRGDGSTQSITFDVSGPSTRFVIEQTTNLSQPNWRAITGALTAAELGTAGTFSDNVGGTSQGYYRVRVVR
jgi:hypothetical protein